MTQPYRELPFASGPAAASVLSRKTNFLYFWSGGGRGEAGLSYDTSTTHIYIYISLISHLELHRPEGVAEELARRCALGIRVGEAVLDVSLRGRNTDQVPPRPEARARARGRK